MRITKKITSIVLAVLMVVSMMSVMAVTASATSYDSVDSEGVYFHDLQVGDTVSRGVSCYRGCPVTLVLKGGTYGVNAAEGRVEQICNSDLSVEIDYSAYEFYSDSEMIFVYDHVNFENKYYLCDKDGKLSTQMVVLAKEGSFPYGVTLTVGGYDPASVPADYYVVGTMNSWNISEDYKMALNVNNESEYWIQNVPLHSGDAIKVVSSTDGSTVQYWYPDGTNNDYTIDEDGYYNVYVAPAGHDGWYSNCIYVSYQRDLNYAAQIGTTKYETLAAAIAAAQSGDAVKLLDNVTLTESLVIPEGKNFTLDLNGKDITGNVNDKLVKNNGTVVVDDSTAAPGHIYNTNIDKQGNAAFVNYGTATIKNGYFGDKNSDMTDANAVNRGAGFQNQGTAVIDGGYFTACDNFTNTAGTGNGYAYAIINYGNITINDATVYGKNNGNLANDEGTMVVNGGTYTLNKPKKNVYYSIYNGSADANTTVNAGTFTNNGTKALLYTGEGSTEIKGGTFTGPKIEQSTGAPAISGGSFSQAVPEEFCADGFIPKDNGNGTYGVKTGSYVAQIGSTKYENLQDALDVVPDGGTVTVLKDITTSGNIFADGYVSGGNRTYTVDLGGYTVSGATFIVDSGNNVTFKNGTIESATYGIQNKATATVDSTATVKSTATDASAVFGAEGSTTNINGTVEGNKYGVIARGGTLNVAGKVTATNDDGRAITLNKGGAADINDGADIDGAYGVVVHKDANLNVNGGDIAGVYHAVSGNGTAADGPYTINVTGGTLTATNGAGIYNPNAQGTLNISGGSITGSTTAVAAGENSTNSISGGTFSSAVPEDFCADGFIPKDNGDGTYGVKTGTYVAEANGVKYETVQDAVAAAGEGGEVKLIADITGNVGIGGVSAPYNTTLDLNGHKITNNGGSGITLYSQYGNPATFTIKDSVGTGGITITKRYPGDGCISDSSGRKVVIEGGTYTSDGQALYISSDEGWEINGGTFNGDVKVVSAVDITAGTINGDINAIGPSWTVDPAEVTISGGTVNGNLNTENDSTYEVSGGTFSNPVPAEFCATGFQPKDNGNGTYTVEVKDDVLTPVLTKENDGNKFGLGDLEYHFGTLLGVQKKNAVAGADKTSENEAQENGNDLRYVAVLKTDILRNAQDYGFVLAKVNSSKTTESVAENINALSADGAGNGAKVISAKGSSNTICGDYGEFGSDTSYKYITCAVNGVEDGTKVVARFYVKIGGKTYYAQYPKGGSYDGNYTAAVAGMSDLG